MRNAVLTHLMMLLSGIALLVALPGCFACADALAGYELNGHLIDANTSEPLGEAEVRVQLFREGEIVGRAETATTDETGLIDMFYDVAFTGPCCVMLECYLAPGRLDESPLGEPPDRIELVVTGASGRGRLVMVLDDTHFVEFRDAYEVPFIGGVVELGDVMIEIAE